MPNENDRLKSYKNNARDLEDMRRRQIESAVELRKQKKLSQDLRRRNLAEEPNHSSHLKFSLKEIIKLLNGSTINQQDESSVVGAVQALRNMLLDDESNSSSIDEIIRANLVQRLIEFLSCDQSPTLQFESAWVLTNICAGSSWQTRYVVEAGAIEPLVRLFSSSSNSNIQEQSAWALGNICGDGVELRDLVINTGAIQSLLTLIRAEIHDKSLSTLIWTIKNMCQHPTSSSHVLDCVLPTLVHVLHESLDKKALAMICSIFSNLIQERVSIDRTIVQVGLVPKLVELVYLHSCDGNDNDNDNDEQLEILSPALRCLANIIACTDNETTQIALNCNILCVLRTLLTNSKASSIKRDAAWTLANVTASGQSQIQAVILAELVPVLAAQLTSCCELCVQKEILWVFINYTFRASKEQFFYLLRCSILNPLCDLLDVSNVDVLKLALVCLINILQVGQMNTSLSQIRCHIEEMNGLEKIERLQEKQNENPVVYDLACRIVDDYFKCKNDDAASYDEIMMTSNNGFTSSV